MCMMLYLASDRPLPTIPWREEQPAFHVCRLEDWDWGRDVRARFSKPHVYYVGSYQRCGCGFQGDFGQAVLCRRELRDYLAAGLAEAGTIELFSCWAGDEGLEPIDRTMIPADLIAQPEFRFEERELFEVARTAA